MTKKIAGTVKEAVLAADFNGVTVEQRIMDNVAKIGEKIELVNFESLSAEFIGEYTHGNFSFAVLVGLDKKGDFADLGKSLALQVAMMMPVAIDESGVDAELVEKERNVGREKAIAEGKPENIVDKIAEGYVKKYLKEVSLLNQEYVDDNKITHAKERVVDKVIKRLEEKFGEMSKKKGNELEFLGMDLKFCRGSVSINMKKHILKAINNFNEEIAKSAATPAKGYLFDVREDTKKLDKKRADNFHNVVASLLFVSRRCRLDIQTTIGFLATRVAEPDEDDWLKLKEKVSNLQFFNIPLINNWIEITLPVLDKFISTFRGNKHNVPFFSACNSKSVW